jgi:hypothetical protein
MKYLKMTSILMGKNLMKCGKLKLDSVLRHSTNRKGDFNQVMKVKKMRKRMVSIKMTKKMKKVTIISDKLQK